MALRAGGADPVRLLIGSFLALILSGTLLLSLPAATPPERPIGAVDALFTATSATCVTGLVVRDTGSAFTLFGQGVILALIQLGGLGVMTFSLLIFSLVRGRLSMVSRSVIEQSLAGTGELQDFWPLLRHVFVFTAVSEAAGATVLFFRWAPEYGMVRGAWHAVFHAISAFCNAGFGLWPDSLVRYRADPVVNVTVMTLIVLGGLGFLTVYDLTRWRRDRRLSLHTRITVTVSAALIVFGALGFWLLERGRTLAGASPLEQLLASLFQSVTPRTAGFNTVDTGALAPGTLFMLIMLMFIGGSPGSCAGGIKTTTFGVLALTAWSRLGSRRNVNAFQRTIGVQSVENTLTIAMGASLGAVVAVFCLVLLQGAQAEANGGTFIAYLFEAVSALGTVGLSTGVTPALSVPSRLLVTLLMFLGRLGPLSVAAAISRESAHDWRYPQEEVMVG